MIFRMIISVDNLFDLLMKSYLTDFHKSDNISLKPFNDSSIISEVLELIGTNVELETCAMWNPAYLNILYAIYIYKMCREIGIRQGVKEYW